MTVLGLGSTGVGGELRLTLLDRRTNRFGLNMQFSASLLNSDLICSRARGWTVLVQLCCLNVCNFLDILEKL